MKFILALFCIYSSCSVNAFEKKINEESVSSPTSPISQPEIVLAIRQQGFEEALSFNYGAVALRTNYSSSNTQRASAAISLQEQDSDFYLSSELTIQSSDSFDISMSANIYHKNILTNNNSPINRLPNNHIPSNYIPSNKKESQYSVIGHYNISSHWKLSGGIVFTNTTTVLDDNQSNFKVNNVALVKTSYRF